MEHSVGLSDYYTSWSAGLLTLTVVVDCLLLRGRVRVLRVVSDAACANSLMVGLVGAYLSCIIPKFAEPNKCRYVRARSNAHLHALPSAIAMCVLLSRHRTATSVQIVGIIALFMLLYMVTPTKCGRRGFARSSWAYGVDRPFQRGMIGLFGVCVFAYAATVNASVYDPSCKGVVSHRSRKRSTHYIAGKERLVGGASNRGDRSHSQSSSTASRRPSRPFSAK